MNRKVFDIIILFLFALLPFLWLPGEYTVLGHDSGYPIDPDRYFQTRLSTWRQDEVFGADMSHSMGAIPLFAVEAGFVKIGFSVPTAQKFTFIFWFLAIELSMYTFASYLNRAIAKNSFPIVATILYAINYYTLEFWKLGAGTTFSAYTAFPLVLLVLFRLKDRLLTPLVAGILTAVVLTVFNAGGGFGLLLFGSVAAGIAVFLIYHIFINEQRHRLEELKRYALWALVFAISFVALNAYWIFPFVYYVRYHFDLNVAASGGVAGVKSWTDSVSQTTSLINLFRLQGIPDWYNNIKHPFSEILLGNIGLIIVSFLFSATTIGALMVTHAQRVKCILGFFFFLFLVGMFFSAGTHPPTGILYGWMMDHIPGFVAFRSPQFKFMPAIFLPFSVLAAYSVSVALSSLKRLWAIAAWGALSGAFFLYHFAFFTPDFFDWNVPLTFRVEIPSYIKTIAPVLDREVGDRRVLLIPRLNTLWKVETYRWGVLAAQNLVSLLTGHGVLENQVGTPPAVKALVSRLYDDLRRSDPFAKELLRFFRSPVALLRRDMFSELDWTPTESSEGYEALLAQQGFANTYDDGEWSLFTLPEWRDPGLLRTYTNVTAFAGSDEAISGSVVGGATAYVWNESVKVAPALNDLSAVLPLTGFVTAVPCGSCVLSGPPDSLPNQSVRLLPGSRLYFLKQLKEQKLFEGKDPKQRTITMLGLTRVRLLEITKLRSARAPEHLVLETATLLSTYWRVINEYVEQYADETDYLLLRSVSNYLEDEQRQIATISQETGGLTRDALMEVLQNMFSISQRVDALREQTLKGSLTYQIPESTESAVLYMDRADLPYDRTGRIVLPSTVSINGNDIHTKPTITGSKIELGKVSVPERSVVTITFPQTDSLVDTLQTEPNMFSNVTETCLSSNVSSFQRNHSYRIGVGFSDVLPGTARAYIRFHRKTINTSTRTMIPNSEPIARFDLVEKGEKLRDTIIFSGSDGDTGAVVSICTNGSNPNRYIASVRVDRAISPSLYVERGNLAAVSTPLAYTKIRDTAYEFTLKLDHGSVVVFDQRFDLGWRIKRLDSIPNNDQADGHFPINGYLNAWYIPSESKGKYLLYFYPQILFERGVYVTLGAVTCLLILWGISRVRKGGVS